MMQDEQMVRITAVQAQYTDQLMQKANVVGIAVGLVQRSGQATGEIGLVVLVKVKVPADELAAEDLIPSEIEGVRVDVQEVGEITAF
ncbi:MAG: hypothetical protein K8I60_12085 [Anaerolineae bacterium]|nr:hypothetical protein [Anaerolineae bacterium]